MLTSMYTNFIYVRLHFKFIANYYHYRLFDDC